MRRRRLGSLVVPAMLALALAACGGDADPGDTTTPAEVESEAPTTEEPTTEEPATEEPTADDPGGGTTVTAGREHRTSTDGETVHCDGGGEVYVLNDDVTVTGSCADVDVEAAGVTLSVETVNDLDIASDGNTVDAGSVRDLDIPGNDNVVTVGEVTNDIDVEGNGNTVTFGSGNPEIDDEGAGNSITSG